MSDIAPLLLPWFEQHGRKDLPWQQQLSAYRVWVSEIMLQQTQVNTVIPYFQRFMQAFPDIQSLAHAHLDHLLKLWAGLGYYARARNLHHAARIVCDQHNGELPRDLAQLMALPGIGRSTAGAILSLAFGYSASILDGNVKRVLARVYQVPGWSGQASTQKKLWLLAEQQTPEATVAHYNQAMMDLGSGVCRRSRPACESCPLTSLCLSFKQQTQAQYPQPKPRKSRPHKHCWMLIHQHENRLLLERRPEQGIWGGLWSLPELQSLEHLDAWQHKVLGQTEKADSCRENILRHQFSHFDLSISIAQIPLSKVRLDVTTTSVNDGDQFQWIERNGLHNFGLPAPVLKILSEHIDL